MSAVMQMMAGGLGDRFVNAVVMTAFGSGYTSASVVFTPSGVGSGAAATANLGNPVSTGGVINSASISNAGRMLNITSLSIAGGGSGASVSYTSALTGNRVLGTVYLTQGGTGYATAPAVSFTGITGTAPTATANISGGVVTSITVNTYGDFAGTPTCVLTGGGFTTAATISLVDHYPTYQLTSVTVDAGGSGYSAPTITVNGDASYGVRATISASATAVNTTYSILSVTMTNGGTVRYGPLPAVSFTGSGTGAAGFAT